MEQLAGDGELQCRRRDFVSASGVGESDDDYFTAAEKGGALPRRDILRTWKVGNAENGVEKVSWMKDLMRKCSKAGDFVADFCAGKCSTAKACMMLDSIKKFVRCDVNPQVLHAAETDLVLNSVSQVLILRSDISGGGKVEAAAKVFTDGMGALLARMKANV